MSASSLWLSLRDFDGPSVDLDAGRPGGHVVEIRPEVEGFARAWERACREAARHDAPGPMGLLERYVRPLMINALRKADAFPQDPWSFTLVVSGPAGYPKIL